MLFLLSLKKFSEKYDPLSELGLKYQSIILGNFSYIHV
jgi:hypothetical protein